MPLVSFKKRELELLAVILVDEIQCCADLLEDANMPRSDAESLIVQLDGQYTILDKVRRALNKKEK